MRKRNPILAALVAVALTGCGDRNLILEIDVLSYIAESDRTAMIVAPPGPDLAVTVVNDQSISLLEGVGDVAEVQSVTLMLGALAADSVGSGDLRLRVFLSDADTDPVTTAPVLDVPVSLTPGETDTIAVTIDADPRVRDLFGRRQVRATVDALVHPTSPEPLAARITLTRLDAVVVCRRSGL